jgi:hypothetical protein
MRTNWIVFPALALGVLVACSSDPKDPYSYATGKVPCASAADCCVVFDTCKGTGLVVGKADVLKVQGLVAQTNDAGAGTCVKCMPPAIEVTCENEVCVGNYVPGDPTKLPPDLSKDHCGPGNVPAGTTTTTKGATLSCQ